MFTTVGLDLAKRVVSLRGGTPPAGWWCSGRCAGRRSSAGSPRGYPRNHADSDPR